MDAIEMPAMIAALVLMFAAVRDQGRYHPAHCPLEQPDQPRGAGQAGSSGPPEGHPEPEGCSRAETNFREEDKARKQRTSMRKID